MAILDREQALDRRIAYAERVNAVLGELTQEERIANPVEAFLWTYYSYRPRELRRYHPGALEILVDGEEVTSWRGYGLRSGGFGVRLDFIKQRRPTLEFITSFLRTTAKRPAQHNCFGMHEWAMVYEQNQEEIRHATWPLRLGSDATTNLIDEIGLRCTHFDAFRFFTPGARRLREIDMRASPYDLSNLQLAPIRVETPEGRIEYANEQRRLAKESMPIRNAIADYCEEVMALREAFDEAE